MIIVQLYGGLGNQMFQYATGRALSLKNDTDLKLDLHAFESYSKGITKRKYKLDIFNIKTKFASIKEVEEYTIPSKIMYLLNRNLKLPTNPYSSTYIKEKTLNFDESVMKLSKKIYLDGYWQTEKYFKNFDKQIKIDFIFKSEPSSKNKVLLEQIKSTNSVSIHVRRTDYVSDKETNEFHGVIGTEYYRAAIVLLSQKVKNPRYFIFSDDISWCKINLKFIKDAVFVDYNKDDKSFEDMRLMSKCMHNIIANSSFSWWGAWLNNNPNKIVIAPKKWFNDPTVGVKDRVPKGWLKI